MTAGDPSLLTLVALARAIRERKLSPLEAVDACLHRIERLNPALNAFLEIRADTARDAARRLTAQTEPSGPLHGVPVAHKDMFWRRGKRISGGSKILPDIVGAETATVLTRIDAAGAIDLGPLHMTEFAAGWTGENEHYGDCRNPWNTDHGTGGSSSGPAAAVAARMIPGALGSDTGGSIRNPAAFCGLYGLRPTYGAVSRHGAMPRAWSLDTIGPLARTAADCALLFAVVAGRDPKDPTTFATAASGSHASRPDLGAAATLRVGFAAELLQSPELRPDIAAALSAALEVLREAGVAVRPISLPGFAEIYRLTDTIQKAEAASIHAEWLANRRQDYGRAVLLRLEAGQRISAAEYLNALKMRGVWLRHYLETIFAQVDVVFLPGPYLPAPRLRRQTDYTSASIDTAVAALTTAVRPISYLGLPTLSVPCGFTADRLPIGFQICARPFQETDLFNLAGAYERETAWTLTAPDIVAASP